MSNKIPTTLEECFAALVKMTDDPEDLVYFRLEGATAHHHGLGRWIRNNWGLWKREGPLYSWLVALGLEHADDMSGLILESFHRKLTDKPLDIEGQVRHYQEHWEQQKK